MDHYIEALQWRFACKEFSDKPVPEEEIKYLMEAARLAPGSFNIQPWHVIVVQDKKLLKDLLPVSMNQSQVATTQCLFVFCGYKDVSKAFDNVIAGMKQEGATDEQLKGYNEMVRGFIASMPADMQLTWSQRQMSISVGMMLSAAALHRIDAGPMEGLDPAGVAKVLKLPEYLLPRVNVAIGYRKADPSRPKYRNAPEVMFERRN